MLVVIWWMYGGDAWLTNVLAPDRFAYQALLLGGMASFLVLSLAIPTAFDGGGLAFGLAYVVIVLVHAGLFTRSSRGESAVAIFKVAPLNLSAALLRPWRESPTAPSRGRVGRSPWRSSSCPRFGRPTRAFRSRRVTSWSATGSS